MDGPEVPRATTAMMLANSMLCVALHCHVEVSHLTTDHLLRPLKQHFGCSRFHSNEEVEMVGHKQLRMQEPNLYCDRILKLMPRKGNCLSVLEDYVEK